MKSRGKIMWCLFWGDGRIVPGTLAHRKDLCFEHAKLIGFLEEHLKDEGAFAQTVTVGIEL